MRVSKFYLCTLKEAPAEAEVMSQKLMLRAGLIKKVTSGIYSWMPLGLMTLRKVEQVVREEMNRAGALETYLPHVLPAELWQETGRWDKFGPLLLKIKDRQQRDFLFGPTHEEVVTDIVRKDIRSYRQLPVNLYQIQVKFRDEIRPRFGVMRGREFLMKDAYSFDVDRDALMRSYRAMYDGVRAHLHAARARVSRGRGRYRRDRRLRFARVPGARRVGRGRDRVQQRIGLCGERRAGRGAGADDTARPHPRNRCARCPRRASRPARRSRNSSASRSRAPSSAC